ncbi:MAG: hypothetical protein KA164_01510 [Rhodoferax sp.]|jgi:hypothetical protein|nr:hypothetical protein [Rhodoferax sp.]
MKLMIILMAALLAGAHVSVHAQALPGKATGKAQVKPAHREIRVLARNIAAEVRAPLTQAELDVAARVHVGTLPCELGQTVVLVPDAAQPGYFSLRIGANGYRVSPEETTTGAIRLEDKAAGIVWLQLANKSMLMSQKLGRRLADECRSPLQAQVAQAMLVNPPPSVLDAVSKVNAPTTVAD